MLCPKGRLCTRLGCPTCQVESPPPPGCPAGSSTPELNCPPQDSGKVLPANKTPQKQPKAEYFPRRSEVWQILFSFKGRPAFLCFSFPLIYFSLHDDTLFHLNCKIRPRNELFYLMKTWTAAADSKLLLVSQQPEEVGTFPPSCCG